MRKDRRFSTKLRCVAAEGLTWCRYCMCHMGKIRGCYARAAHLDPGTPLELMRSLQPRTCPDICPIHGWVGELGFERDHRKCALEPSPKHRKAP